MKIIHTVESYLPSRHGMAEVVRQLSERLVARGHNVTVATSRDPRRHSNIINGVKIADFSIGGKEALGIWGETSRYQEFIKQCGADVVVNFAAQQWATDLVLPLLHELSCKRILVPTGFSALDDRRFRRYFEDLAVKMGEYDACVYLSNTYRDALWAEDQGLTNGVVIPNGAAAEEFDSQAEPEWRKRNGIKPDEMLILHVAGYLSRAKGQMDAIRILDQAKLSNARLLIVCPEFEKPIWQALNWRVIIKLIWALARGRFKEVIPARFVIAWRRLLRASSASPVHCIALNRSETIQAFLAADLLLFPSHVECSPIVLFEAAASRTPFLTTPAGNAEEVCQWLGCGLVLPSVRLNDAQQSVRALINQSAVMLRTLANDQQRRQEMAERGHHQWKSGFTWDQIADRYENLYSTLMGCSS